MTLGGYLIRRVGSQGQNKTYLIALKLAQFAFLNKRGQTTPILLLDDILISWTLAVWSRSSNWSARMASGRFYYGYEPEVSG